jgi:hypothetical protein
VLAPPEPPAPPYISAPSQSGSEKLAGTDADADADVKAEEKADADADAKAEEKADADADADAEAAGIVRVAGLRRSLCEVCEEASAVYYCCDCE